MTGDRLQALLKRLDGCWDSIPVGGEKATKERGKDEK